MGEKGREAGNEVAIINCARCEGEPEALASGFPGD
jgi:hypothetical protein